jgi:hypothetical protein
MGHAQPIPAPALGLWRERLILENMQWGRATGDGKGDRKKLAGIGRATLWGVLCCQVFWGGALCRAQKLPDAPGSLGTISGTVTDADGALVAGASVTLTSVGAAGKLVGKTVTGSEGGYRFEGVAAGRFRLTATARGLAAGTAAGTLLPGQQFEAAPIVLAVAVANTTVEVNLSRKDVAVEEVHDEEQQRVLGIVPNYFVTYSRNPAPLDAKQKFNLTGHVIFDPTNFIFSAAAAGIEQGLGTFPGYGPGWEGFGKRYGAALANASTSTLLRGGVFPALLRQDPRYYYRGVGSVRSRAAYALETAVICKGDNGRWQPNYSSFLGNLGAGAISNLYYPASSRHGAALTFENALLGIAGDGVGHLMQEFLFKRFTRKGP